VPSGRMQSGLPREATRRSGVSSSSFLPFSSVQVAAVMGRVFRFGSDLQPSALPFRACPSEVCRHSSHIGVTRSLKGREKRP